MPRLTFHVLGKLVFVKNEHNAGIGRKIMLSFCKISVNVVNVGLLLWLFNSTRSSTMYYERVYLSVPPQ